MGKKNKTKVVDATKRIKEVKVYEYKGKKNETVFPDLISLLKKTQKEMKTYLKYTMEYYYEKQNIIDEDGFLYIRGKNPVCLTSHMDTTPTVSGIKRTPVTDWYEDTKTEDDVTHHVISSPQGIGGDDRCGIWTILNILKETDFRPYIVFCEDEEIGCVGSNKFSKTKWCEELENCKFIIEIDRRGNNDAVFYDDINYDFHDWVQEATGYKENFGSCSDISYLCPACGRSGVNLSSGYYNEHTLEEYIVPEETLRTKEAVIKLIEEAVKEETESFEYKEHKYSSYGFGRYSSYYNYDYDDWYGYNYEGYSSKKSYYDDEDSSMYAYIQYLEINGEENEEIAEGNTKLECIANFLIDHPDVCCNDILDISFEEGDTVNANEETKEIIGKYMEV